VLPLSDGLFRDAVREVIGEQLAVDEILVDLAALKMVSEPQTFDMVLTTNLYGDILSDAAAYWCGGLGVAPSLNWGDGIAVAEPVHGSAPDIAGQGTANPIAAILSAALLVRTYWHNESAAEKMEGAVFRTLEQHHGKLKRTSQITRSILANLDAR
jgi:homoisocitrate dehydrogenase